MKGFWFNQVRVMNRTLIRITLSGKEDSVWTTQVVQVWFGSGSYFKYWRKANIGNVLTLVAPVFLLTDCQERLLRHALRCNYFSEQGEWGQQPEATWLATWLHGLNLCNWYVCVRNSVWTSKAYLEGQQRHPGYIKSCRWYRAETCILHRHNGKTFIKYEHRTSTS